MGRFLEKYKRELVALLSAAVLLGSGVSLGIGFSELRLPPPEFEASGFSSDSSSQPLNQPANQPISGLININTASAAELEMLPGIGAVKAAAIVSYRGQNGPFKSATEIQNVSGIGEKTFDQIKELITVK